jgi:hypothetical protein
LSIIISIFISINISLFSCVRIDIAVMSIYKETFHQL